MKVVIPASPMAQDPGPQPGGTTLPSMWSDRWASQPDRPVLLSGGDRPAVLTGAGLDSATAAAADALHGRGVVPGDRVLWSCHPSLDAVVTLLGCLRLGALVVAISPASSAAEVAFVVGDAQPRAAWLERAEQDTWVTDADPSVSVLRVDGAAGALAPSAVPPLDGVAPSDDALIVYTSGTTGTPKGAVHTHASLLAGVAALTVAWGWTPQDRLILTLPLFHVHGLCAGLFGTLTAGASAIVCGRFSEEEVLAAVPDCTMFFGVPTMYHRLAASGSAAHLASLRLCVSGSAPLAADLWTQLHGMGVSVLERYGMTETLMTLSNPLSGERRPGSVGFPLPGVEAAITDPDEHGVGELLVRGATLCRGYWGKGNLPVEDGWFPTGDLASVAPDGYVSIRGRQSDMIITGGHNVYPAEVEAVLSRHPSVAEVAVVGVPSSEWGESVAAFVVGSDGSPDVAALEALARDELAPFKRPRQITVVDALPRNAMGKVMRRALA